MSKTPLFKLPVIAAVSTLLLSSLACAESIVFVGNSFTYGPSVVSYNAANVRDLTNSGFGGVPGIFKRFADEAGLNYSVAIEAIGGTSLQFHYTSMLAQLGSQRWDQVVLQDLSTLNPTTPGDPSSLYTYSGLLERFFHGTGPANANANPAAGVFLMQTWARADQVYNTPGGRWNGTSIEAMTTDLHNAYYTAASLSSGFAGVAPVGDAWLRAIQGGAADRNPYDGIDAGKLNLWDVDFYHPSVFGAYLEALTIFGKVTGRDPRSLGASEIAAAQLGISSSQALQLQSIAFTQLQAAAVPEPASVAMWLVGAGFVFGVARRRAGR